MESNGLKRDVGVILLKSNDSSTQNTFTDRYVNYLSENLDKQINYCIEQINMLKFTCINESVLKQKLSELNRYKCLILTSKQTIEAIENVLKCDEFQTFNSFAEMKSQDEQLDKDFVQCKLTVYCVGEATSNRFKQLKQKTSLFDGCLIRTCASGKQNAMELSKLIVDDFQEIKANTEMLQNENYALYLCSSIRRDDLSIELSKHDISFDELHVYDTIPCQHAVYKLNSLITERFNTLPLIFMVFFSPSICQAVFDDLELKSKLLEASGNSLRFLSIGPSTSSKLKTYIQSDELKIVHQLDEPSPEALLRLLHELTSQ